MTVGKLSPQALASNEIYYTFKNEINTKIEFNDQKAAVTNKVKIGLLFEVLSDTGNNAQLRITYDKIHIALKDKNGEQEFNDNNPNGTEPLSRMLSNLKGSSLLITTNPKGEILKVSGQKEIYDKILADLGGLDDASRVILQTQLSKLAGDEFVKNNVGRLFKLFPDTAVQVGDAWSSSEQQTTDLKFLIDTKNTLSSVNNGLAEVETESTITSDKNSSGTVMGYGVASNLKGEQTGTFAVDTATGMLMKGKTKASVEGTVQVMGRNIPITIEMKRTIEGKKL